MRRAGGRAGRRSQLLFGVERDDLLVTHARFDQQPEVTAQTLETAVQQLLLSDRALLKFAARGATIEMPIEFDGGRARQLAVQCQRNPSFYQRTTHLGCHGLTSFDFSRSIRGYG